MMRVRVLLACSLLLACLQFAAAAERMQALGSSISMELPVNFAPSTDAMGFLAPRSRAAVTLVEFPATAEMWSDLQQPGAFVAKFGFDPNLTLEPVETLNLGGKDFLFAEGRLMGPDSAVRVWLVATGPNPGMLFNFTQAEGLPPVLNRERVIEALASIEISPSLSFDEQLAATGVTVVPQAPFVHNLIILNSTIVLSSEAEPVGVKDAVKVVILLPRGQSAPVPLKTVLATYLGATGNGEEATEEDADFAGGKGLRQAGLTKEGDGFVAYVSQVNGRVVVLIAQGPSGDFTDELVATIDAIAQSVARTAQ